MDILYGKWNEWDYDEFFVPGMGEGEVLHPAYSGQRNVGVLV